MAQYKITGFNSNVSNQSMERINRNFFINFPTQFECTDVPTEDTIVKIPTNRGEHDFLLFWFQYEPLENTTQV